ncbi:MAG: DUF885 family protein [Gammaproteobacteria bacterium]|nr:DUF885 family protein [Gammaproteobacteria bacterium]
MTILLYRLPPLLLLSLVLSACSPDGDAEPVNVTAAPSSTELLHEALESYFALQLERNPLRATFLGDHRFNDRLAITIAPEYIAESLAIERSYLDRVEAVDPAALDHADRLSREIFLRERRHAIAGAAFPDHLMPVNQFRNMGNTMAQLGSGQGAQPFATVEDFDAFISRMVDFSRWVDQAIANMREGMTQQVVQPAILMERVLDQLAAHSGPAAETLFARPLASLPSELTAEAADNLRQRYLAAIDEVLIPAYATLHDFIRDEYLPAARTTHGMHALPNGQDWYSWLVQGTTTTNLTPGQIHDIGVAEVARIHQAIEEVMAEVGFEGDLHDFFAFTATDPKFYVDDPEELLAAYEALRERVQEGLDELFDLRPVAEYEIRPVEAFRERAAAGASYMRPAADGSRPGIFYVNTYDLSARPLWAVESLFLHEAVPGHHYQIALQQEQTELPRFRRFGGNTAFIEGWALYAESLGRELGLYTDPYQYFGMLNAELWRAIRLVVDTGLHLHGWNRDEVLEYMFANSSVGRARAVAEAERYMAIPSQALAYKVGQLEFLELRQRAEAALGDSFDIRAFHNLILRNGPLPLDVLTAEVSAWIETTASSRITEFSQPAPGVWLGDPPTKADLDRLRQQGVGLVIDLRTAGEEIEDAADAATSFGLRYLNLPVGLDLADADVVAGFAAALEAATEAGEGVLLHCASGNRAGEVWALYQVEQGMSPAAALADAEAAGTRGERLERLQELLKVE